MKYGETASCNITSNCKIYIIQYQCWLQFTTCTPWHTEKLWNILLRKFSVSRVLQQAWRLVHIKFYQKSLGWVMWLTGFLLMLWTYGLSVQSGYCIKMWLRFHGGYKNMKHWWAFGHFRAYMAFVPIWCQFHPIVLHLAVDIFGAFCWSWQTNVSINLLLVLLVSLQSS